MYAKVLENFVCACKDSIWVQVSMTFVIEADIARIECFVNLSHFWYGHCCDAGIMQLVVYQYLLY